MMCVFVANKSGGRGRHSLEGFFTEPFFFVTLRINLPSSSNNEENNNCFTRIWIHTTNGGHVLMLLKKKGFK